MALYSLCNVLDTSSRLCSGISAPGHPYHIWSSTTSASPRSPAIKPPDDGLYAHCPSSPALIDTGRRFDAIFSLFPRWLDDIA